MYLLRRSTQVSAALTMASYATQLRPGGQGTAHAALYASWIPSHQSQNRSLPLPGFRFGGGFLGGGDFGGVFAGDLIPGGFLGSLTLSIHVPQTPAHASVSSGAASGVASTHLKKQLQKPSPGVSQWSFVHRIEQDAATAPRQAMHPRHDHGV